MTQETVRGLNDSELAQVIAWAEDEQKSRAEKKKQETISKIKEMAGLVGISVNIVGVRGRPVKGGKTLNRARQHVGALENVGKSTI